MNNGKRFSFIQLADYTILTGLYTGPGLSQFGKKIEAKNSLYYKYSN